MKRAQSRKITLAKLCAVIEQRFDEQSRRLDRIEAGLVSLTESVDHFLKNIMDHNQELVALHK